ncbi:MAG: hypothetical protein Q8875_02900 [Pigeon pea little leaf phytoplasma]|nr:hypothetical protein [Pigeon pea little leaf phytoplasma]
MNDAVAFVSYMDIGLERDVHVWQLIRESEEGVMWEKIIRRSANLAHGYFSAPRTSRQIGT